MSYQSSMLIRPVANGIGEADKQFLDEFWREYDDYSAWGLVEKTHKSGSPWSKVYNEGAGNSGSNTTGAT